eukprot:TRINITY_DN2727_c0_g2_i3.p1 TRINITY_DN2727_c0_g2~~TRINITY_DN2727_c0_g2_i3.p1  ORF type:complete len:299 (-),score=41.43 TRINITY_DN2727_c0_g2_i3:429-1325(-)
MIRRPPRSTHCISSAASDVYKRQTYSNFQSKSKFFDHYSQKKTQLTFTNWNTSTVKHQVHSSRVPFSNNHHCHKKSFKNQKNIIDHSSSTNQLDTHNYNMGNCTNNNINLNNDSNCNNNSNKCCNNSNFVRKNSSPFFKTQQHSGNKQTLTNFFQLKCVPSEKLKQKYQKCQFKSANNFFKALPISKMQLSTKKIQREKTQQYSATDEFLSSTKRVKSEDSVIEQESPSNLNFFREIINKSKIVNYYRNPCFATRDFGQQSSLESSALKKLKIKRAEKGNQIKDLAYWMSLSQNFDNI